MNDEREQQGAMATALLNRHERLGASDAAAALGLSPFLSEWELAGLKTGRIEPDGKDTKPTRAGRLLEPTVLDVAEHELGELQRDVLVYAPHVDFPLASTLDGRVISSGVPVEAKTTGIEGPVYGEWGDEGSDIVPSYYLVQAVVQMICTEADLVHLYALIGGRGFVRYRILRDEQVCAEVTERLARWWQRHVVERIEPTHSEPIPLEIVKRLRREPAKTVDLFADDLLTVWEYEQAKSDKSAAEKACEAAQAKLLLLLGDAEAASLPDGRQITYLESMRKGYVVADTRYRTLRIKKGK